MNRLPWSTAWRIARRDLPVRFRGLRLLLACLFLGVGAIAAIGTLTGSIERELATRGRTILGGDIEAQVWQRGLTTDERRVFAALGTLSEGTRMQGMASAGGCERCGGNGRCIRMPWMCSSALSASMLARSAASSISCGISITLEATPSTSDARNSDRV